MSFEELNFGEQKWKLGPSCPWLLPPLRSPALSLSRPQPPLGCSQFAAVGSCEQPAVTDEVAPQKRWVRVRRPSLPGLQVEATFLGPDGSGVCPAPALGWGWEAEGLSESQVGELRERHGQRA